VTSAFEDFRFLGRTAFPAGREGQDRNGGMPDPALRPGSKYSEHEVAGGQDDDVAGDMVDSARPGGE
jgi:hypothetical protein